MHNRRAKPELYGRGFRAGITTAHLLAETGLIFDAIQRASAMQPRQIGRDTPEDAEAWHTSYVDGLREGLRRRERLAWTMPGATLAERDAFLLKR